MQLIRSEPYTIRAMAFRPCADHGMWFVARRDLCGKESGKCVAFIFGSSAEDITLYEQRYPESTLDSLIESAVTEHTGFGLPKGDCYWLEYNGEKFELCDGKPKWANYDCGLVEE